MKLLSLARDLRRRRARERQELFVAEGVRAAEELTRSPLALRGALLSADAAATPRLAELRAALVQRGVPIEDVSAPEFASAAETESPQGILVIAEIPNRSLEAIRLGDAPRLLVLDAVQDPGNVGTILRTAAALGVDATIAMPGTVDLWNAKVVRSTMGALFHHTTLSCTWPALAEFLAERAVPLWGADARGPALDADAAPRALALAVGNEGAGLSADAHSLATRLVSLPISGSVESLNVAVATGILLYELRAR